MASATIREHAWFSYNHLWDGHADGGINFTPFIAGVDPGWGNATYAIHIPDPFHFEWSLYVYGPLLLGSGACGMYCISCVELYIGNWLIATI